MPRVTIQETQAGLPDLIHGMKPSEEIVITENDQPVARLVREESAVRRRPQPGLARGMITIMADDDEHLKDFAE